MLNRNTDSVIYQSYNRLGELSYKISRNSLEGEDGTRMQDALWTKLIKLYLYLNVVADVIEIKNNSVYRVVGITDEEFNGLIDCLEQISEINDFPVSRFLLSTNCISYLQGTQGLQGPPGSNGVSSYNAVVFASDASGTNFSTSPSSTRAYIAFKTSTNPIPMVPATFAGLWVKFIADPALPGDPGTNGTSMYTYIRFATDASGSGFSASPIGKKYVAFLSTTVDYLNNPPSTAFTGLWVKYVAEDGLPGLPGTNGKGILLTVGPPNNAIGVDGEVAIDKLNWMIYTKQGGSWGTGTSLIGPTGPPGTNGANGLAGIDGDDAYVYIAFADDSIGTGYTAVFDPNKEWVAFLNSPVPLTPVVANFAGKWAHYRGIGGDRWKTFSTTTMTIATGNKAFVVEKNLAYSTGQRVVIAVDNDPSNRMEGLVIAYDQTTGQISVAVDAIFGSGTFSSWDVNLSAALSGTITSNSYFAELYVDAGAVNQAMTTSFQKLSAFTNLGDLSPGMAASFANDNITPAVSAEFMVYASGTISGAASNRFELQLFKNGVAIPATQVAVTIDATPNSHGFSIKALQNVVSGDIFDVRAKAAVGTPNIVISYARFGMLTTGTPANVEYAKFGGLDFDIGATVIIDGFTVGTGGAFIYEYKCKKGLNIEKGRIEGVYDSTGLVQASRAFPLIMGTIDVTLSVDTNAGNVRLLANITSNDWEITGFRYIL